MKNIVLSFSLLLLSVAAMAAPKTVTRTLSIREFDEIEASFFKVEVIPGEFTGKATITAPRESLDLIDLSTRGDKLTVGLKDDKHSYKGDKRNRNNNIGPVTISVTVPTLTEISASIGAKVEVMGHMKVRKSIDVETSTGAKVTFVSLDAKKVDIDCSTGADVEIYKIACSSLDVDCSTGGSVTISEGRADEAECDASTGASISLGKTRTYSLTKDKSTGGSVRGGTTAR